MNLALICGGKSYEHDISILSTIQIYKGLNKNKYNNIYILYCDLNNDFYLIKNPDINDFINKKHKISFVKKGFKISKKINKIDYALIIMHGSYGEDGKINSFLEFYDIIYINNDVKASLKCLSKIRMKEILFENNIKSLEYQVVNINNYNKINIIYPVILKCDNLGSSIGIEVCNNNDEYIKACHKLFLYDDYILIEPYLTDFIEYNIACKKKVEGIVLSNIEEIKKNDLIYSFNEKYKNNNINKIINPNIDEKINNKLKEITLKVYDLFELDYVCRFDFILKENILYLNEINNIPGSLSYYLFNQSIDEHIHDLIKIKLYKINNNHKLNIKSNLLEYKSSSK